MFLLFTPSTVLIMAAVIPAIFLLAQIYKLDKLEHEPGRLIVSLVFQGVLATIGAIVTESIGMRLAALFFVENTPIYYFVTTMFVVGLSEEGFKYLLLKRKTWNNPEFNCQFDAVVYAVAVSLGFALWENIGYVMSFGLATAVLRALTAVPGHACFGVFMGAWYGMAKQQEIRGNYGAAKTGRVLALLVPMAIHGLYDFIAFMEQISDAFTLIFFVFIIIVFIYAFRATKQMAREDHYM